MRVTFQVNPKDLSAAIGQKRSHIELLKKEFELQEVRIVEDDAIPRKGLPNVLSVS
jgi:transcription antitermination factor NusA-like protein